MVNIDDKIKIHFPMEMKPREQQIDLIQKCKKSINSGKKFLLINAPTGSGKSYLTIMLSNWYKNYINEDAKIDIITNTKLLQDQYKNSFDFIKVLKGQSNYNCLRHGGNCMDGKELNKLQDLKKCDSCPYDIDKEIWINSEIGLTNFHLINSFFIYVPFPTLSKRDARLLIIDEAHSFESIFLDYLSTKLSAKLLKKYGMELIDIESYEEKLNNIKNVIDFMSFIENDFLPHIKQLNNKFVTLLKDDANRDLYIKYFLYTSTQKEKFENILKKYNKDPDNWSLDVIYSKDKRVELLVEPIWGYDYLNEYVWSKYDHVIFMSGSILDRDMFCFINGLKKDLTDYYELPSVFPLENRPLYYIKCGKMTYDCKKETFNNQIPIIEKILKKYKEHRGIIHTTNYELSNWIKNLINDKRLLFHETENREDVYKNFIKEKKKKNAISNSIIVSPSMTTGISLDDNLSRFQLLLKVPYPNISSNKIKARQRSDPKWYYYQTCIEILQAYGRIVRSDVDWGYTFILDSCFSDLLKKTNYFPRWFTDAIKVLK